MSCILTDKILSCSSTEHCDHPPGPRDAGAIPAAWHSLVLQAGPSWHIPCLCNPCTILLSGLAPIQQRSIIGLCWDEGTPSAWQGDMWLLRGGYGLCEG